MIWAIKSTQHWTKTQNIVSCRACCIAAQSVTKIRVSYIRANFVKQLIKILIHHNVKKKLWSGNLLLLLQWNTPISSAELQKSHDQYDYTGLKIAKQIKTSLVETIKGHFNAFSVAMNKINATRYMLYFWSKMCFNSSKANWKLYFQFAKNLF